MSKQQHTPGPWEILSGPKGRTIHSIGPLSSDEYAGASWLDVSEPDARLIAAAPELLEALESLANSAPAACCSDFNHKPGDFHDHDELCPPLDRYEAACLAARAAITKARGEA